MLEKIGLPTKPSLRGSNWVVDASHCQGCSSQFTFINRKHHCRRCGGLFCNSCTQQRMMLRGQGDSPVRICEPCKQLEEAARFELRYANKNRPSSRGSSKLSSKNDDEILNQILGVDVSSSVRRTSSGSASSSSSIRDVSGLDSGGEISRSYSVGESNLVVKDDIGPSVSPEELRKQALDEKKRYRILKGEGKSEEAMKAFKRGKELERQADALEISIRKNRRKVIVAETQNIDGSKESGRRSKGPSQVGKENDDLASELRELGWTDMDPHVEEKRSVGMSLEGELSSLLGDSSRRAGKDAGTSGIDKSQVVAHKRKALTLKREGKLAEAKEELKKAKVLEKQLEEQELLGAAAAEDSDDEISALISSMDDDNQDDFAAGYEKGHGFNFDHLMGTADDVGDGSNLEVTDDDLMDTELAATLKSLGWTDDSDNQQNNVAQSVPIDREALLSEIHALKREALNQKRAGNVAEAMAQLKKAKLLERDLGSVEDEVNNSTTQNTPLIKKASIYQDIHGMKDVESKLAPKNRLVIQKELLALKKKALTLRRDGRLDEAEEELKKGRVLEQQLEEIDNASKAKANQVENSDMHRNLPIVEGEEVVTDQDMHNPAYLSLLRNLGWKEDKEFISPPKPSNKDSNHSAETNMSSVNIPSRTSRSKGEIQKELLALKRKALALRREGKSDEAEELLRSAKVLETQMAEMEESLQKEIQVGFSRSVDDDDNVKDKNIGLVSPPLKPSTEYGNPFIQSTDPSGSNIPSLTFRRSKGELQRELLSLKRRALVLRREGKTDEAEEVLRSAKVLEAQMVEFEAPSNGIQVEFNSSKDKITSDPLDIVAEEGDADDVTVNDMNDPALLSMLKNLGWKEEQSEPVTAQGKDSKDVSVGSFYSTGPTVISSSSSISAAAPSGKGFQQDHIEGKINPFSDIGFLDSLGAKKGTVSTPPNQSGNILDLLTGDCSQGSHIPASKPEGADYFGIDVSYLPEAHVQAETLPGSAGNLTSKEDKKSSGSDASCLAESSALIGSLNNSPDNLGNKVNVMTEKREELFVADKKPSTDEKISTQGMASESNQSSLRHEVLARKRKALALKREGKLLEAREELRQAKLLEKSLEAETTVVEHDVRSVSVSVSNVSPVQQKEPGTSNVGVKLLSGRDRFKLQQESLSHKRQALKFRREGRTEEAEAEFELAKALELQLEETASQNSSKSSGSAAEQMDDVVVEDLLDPQLLSALKAIGIEDATISSKGPERPGPVKVNIGKGENVIQERVQLEEQIKAEKVKAVNFKRAGKQAEALEALRRAKLFEKKLNSLSSS